MLKSVEGSILRFASFLLVLGLAIGLWIGLWMGFNPQMHRQVTRDLGTTKAFFVRIRNDISTTAHKWEARFKVEAKTPETPETKAQPNTAIWRQISDGFAGLWKSIHGIWLRIIASFHSS